MEGKRAGARRGGGASRQETSDGYLRKEALCSEGEVEYEEKENENSYHPKKTLLEEFCP